MYGRISECYLGFLGYQIMSTPMSELGETQRVVVMEQRQVGRSIALVVQ